MHAKPRREAFADDGEDAALDSGQDPARDRDADEDAAEDHRVVHDVVGVVRVKQSQHLREHERDGREHAPVQQGDDAAEREHVRLGLAVRPDAFRRHGVLGFSLPLVFLLLRLVILPRLLGDARDGFRQRVEVHLRRRARSHPREGRRGGALTAAALGRAAEADERPVPALFLRHELIVRALLQDDGALSASPAGEPPRGVRRPQDDDLIRAPDRGQPVRDDDRRSLRPGHERVERLLNEPLVLGVQRGGGLVQDEHRGVPERGAGDGDALLLPAAELRVLPAHDRVVSGWERGDEVVRHRRHRRADDVLERHVLGGRVRASHGDVLAKRRLEQQRFLGDDPDRGSEVGDSDGRDVHAVQPNDAGGGVVETLE